MEFRAKIKSTMPPIRGSRLVPSTSSVQNAGILLPSTHLSQTDSNIYRSNQSLGLTPNQQIQGVRPALRFTTQFITERSKVQRNGMSQSVCYSQSGADSDRSSRCESVIEYQTTSASRLIPPVDGFNPDSAFQYSQNLAPKDIADFKSLLITRVDSYESKMPEHAPLSGRNHFKKNQENDEKQQNQKQAFTKINETAFWETMYREIKDKSCKFEIQNRELRDKFRSAELQKDKMEEKCDSYLKQISQLKLQKQTVEDRIQNMENSFREVQECNFKLEESMRISRNIIANLNERLEKQDKKMNSMLLNQEKYSQQAWKKREEELTKTVTESQMQKHEEIIKNLNSTIFELKLKLIDEGIVHDEAMETLKNAMKDKHEAEVQVLLKQIADFQTHRQSFLKTLENQAIKELQINFELEAKANEIQTLNGELAKLDELNIQLDSKIVTLISSNQNLAQTIEQLSQEIYFLANDKLILFREKEAMAHLICERDARIQELETSQKTKLMEIFTLKEKMGVNKQKLQALQIVVQEKKNEIELLKVEIESQKQQSSENIAEKQKQYEESVQALKSTNEQLTQKITNLQQKIIDTRQTHEKEMQLMKQQLQQKNDQHSQIVAKTSEEKETLLERILALENEIDSNDSELIDKDVHIEELRSVISSLREEITQVKEQVALREQSNRQRQEEINLKNKEIDEFQAEYRHILEGEIKKISNLYEEASNQIQKQFHSPKRQLSEEKCESPNFSPNDNIDVVCDAIELQAVFQQEKEQMMNRIQELTFTNNALKEELDYFNEMEKNTNDLVMSKIKAFQENMERIQAEKNELEDKNSELSLQIVSLNAKGLFYEGKIEWLEQIYKDLQINLHETTEELLKVEASYVNYRLSKKYQGQIVQEQPSDSIEDEPQPVQQTQVVDEAVQNANEPMLKQEETAQQQNNVQLPSEDPLSNPESSKILQRQQQQALQLKIMIVEEQKEEFIESEDIIETDEIQAEIHASDEEQEQQIEQEEQSDELLIEQPAQLIENDEESPEYINNAQEEAEEQILTDSLNSETVQPEEQIQVLPLLQNELILEDSASN